MSVQLPSGVQDETFEIVIDGSRIIVYADIRGDKLVPGDMYVGKRNTGIL